MTLFIFSFFGTALVQAEEIQWKKDRFSPLDVFQLEYASDPQISPDGTHIVYVRNFMDIKTDRQRSNLWTIRFDGTEHRPLTSGNDNNFSPRWSPDGRRLAYISTASGSPQITIRWMDTGLCAKVSNLTQRPASMTWSPDGQKLAFTMFVPEKPEIFVPMPPKPEGAQWAEPFTTIDRILYRGDGGGYIKGGYSHVFIIPAEGGTPRQLTEGDFHHRGPLCWTPDGRFVLCSANRQEDWEYDSRDTEIYKVAVEDGSLSPLTGRNGPDGHPAVSPDGKQVAYTGYDDESKGYHVSRLYIMNIDGTNRRLLSADFDRSIHNPQWRADGKGLYFLYDSEGNTKLGFIRLNGNISVIAHSIGGLSLGRPYSGGRYTAAGGGRFAFTYSDPGHPAELSAGTTEDKKVSVLTSLNEDLFAHKKLGEVEEIWYASSYDGLKIQGWVVKPPDFNPDRKYPLILEIHGGPYANYGDRFSAEIQLYASAGYVVLYTNPRGSSSYGQKFADYIHHNYPGQDYDDLMSGVDAVMEKGYIDEDGLYVTGGSGGGVLTAWIIGHTDRFRAAVAAKPVINWYSWTLTSDGYTGTPHSWFPGFPWDHLEHYMKRSPISYVGGVTTPTMLLTGEEDYRTPISESEQYYQALRLRKIDAVLVRIPGASHGIASRPSRLVGKVLHILAWFRKH